MKPSQLYLHHEQLLRELHRLMQIEPEGAEAEAIRDQMDVTWFQLTEAERKAINALSASLYTETDET